MKRYITEALTLDAAVPNLLTDDSPPRFYPTMADAVSFGGPLLVGL